MRQLKMERAKKQRRVIDAAQCSEDNVALGFAEAHSDFRRVELHAAWLKWDSGVWREDSTLAVYDAIRKFCRTVADASDDDRPEMRRANYVAAVERLCRSDRRYAMTPDQFDADDWILNTPAGFIDLRSGNLLPHDRDRYCKKMTAVAPEGDCPRWRSFLAEITNGNTELISYLQRLVGYCLTGSTIEHSLHFFFGSGANGKSVFLNTITGILADYAYTAPIETFTETHNESHPTELAALDGARLVVSQETEHGKEWAQSRVKSLSAGDLQTARKMRRDFYTFTPKCKIVIAGNAKPRLTTVDEAMRRRFHIVPFTVCILPADRDFKLSEKLVDEWPGILAWAVEGCLEYQRDGLNPPASVIESTRNYLESQDLFADWLATECIYGEEHWHPKMSLFKAWKQFVDQAGERPGRLKDFGERMENAGFHEGRDNSRGRYWSGLKLRPQENFE
jgi:putative DNA primase/helicase